MDNFPGVQQPFMSLPFFEPGAVTPSTRPCPVCLRGFAWIRWIRKWKLDASANNGRLFCRLVVKATNFYASGLDYAAGIGIYHETTFIDVVWMDDTRSSSRVSLYDVPDFGPFATLPGFAMPEMPPVQEIIGDTGSDRAMKLAKQWIYNCVAKHADCKALSTRPLPKRVLDVGQPEPGQGRVSKGRNICLYETKGQCVEYVCLSHCWGTAPCSRQPKRTFTHACNPFNSINCPRRSKMLSRSHVNSRCGISGLIAYVSFRRINGIGSNKDSKCMIFMAMHSSLWQLPVAEGLMRAFLRYRQTTNWRIWCAR
jgi:hypothetical protein